jgi:uncharacterized membrane protein YgdD (TMEM256/DUF423 family)
VRLRWVAAGALSAALAVACGAFGAHALRARLDAAQLDVWRTAVDYHALHALALIATGLVEARRSTRLTAAGVAFALGTLCFSGSLYALALGGPRWLGPVTPLGGLAFLAGWLLLAHAAWSARNPPERENAG